MKKLLILLSWFLVCWLFINDGNYINQLVKNIYTKNTQQTHKKINRVPPKIFIINLDRTPERFQYVAKQLDKYNLQYERFSAIDGYDLEFQNVKTGQFLTQQQKDNFRNYTWKQKPVLYNVMLNNQCLLQLDIKQIRSSLGEIGLTCSHREIWKLMVQKGIDKAIIFEDDVILEPNFREKMLDYLEQLPEDWDIACLGVGRRNNKYKNFIWVGEIFKDVDEVKDHPLVAKIQPTNYVYGTYGYVISLEGAKKLLKLSNVVNWPVDSIIYQEGGINTGYIKGYVSMKKLLEPKLGQSVLKQMGRGF